MSDRRATMTPRAAAAFRDYVALGPDRSLRALHARYRRRSAHEAPTRRLETLRDWSARYGWQERIAGATTAHADLMLAQAAELDAISILRTSEAIAAAVETERPLPLDAVIKLREAVRRPRGP